MTGPMHDLRLLKGVRYMLVRKIQGWSGQQVLAAIVLLSAATAAVAQTTQTLTFSASAYGSQAFVGKTVLLGRTAVVNVSPCTTQVGASQSNNTASVNVPPLLTNG